MRVMTFNVFCAGNGEHHWCRRQPLVRDIIKKYMPDFFCIQEAHYGWMRYLTGQLKDIYAYVGIGKDDGLNKGEFSPVFYRKDKFELSERFDFWLSETPEKPSLGWDGAENRTCSGGVFRNIQNGEFVVVFNTHLDHVGKTAQCEGAGLIIDRISRLGDMKAVLMGDFNVTPQDKAYRLFVDAGFSDARSIALETDNIDSFHWFGTVSKMIDFIFVKNDVKVKKLKTVTDRIDGRYPSDHYPVVADIE